MLWNKKIGNWLALVTFGDYMSNWIISCRFVGVKTTNNNKKMKPPVERDSQILQANFIIKPIYSFTTYLNIRLLHPQKIPKIVVASGSL